MTQEKLKRVVTAAAVAGTLIVVCLLAVIVYQIVHMIVLDNRIKKVEKLETTASGKKIRR